MAGLALLLLTAGLAGAAALLPPVRSLAVVLATVTLVPGVLPLPGLPGVLTVHRVVLLAALAGLLVRCARGRLPWEVLRPPPLAYRLLLVLGLLAVIGVGLLQPPTDPGAAARSWQAFAAQLLVLVVVVALARAGGRPELAVLALVVAVVAAALVTVVERATGQSYARQWYRAVPALLSSDPAQALAERGGHVRVRAAADFTLAYAWSAAACAPLLLVAAALRSGWRRYLLLAGLPLVLVSVLWTSSRSVALPAVVALLVVAVAVGDRVVRAVTTATVAVGVLVVLATPSLLRTFSVAADQGSIDVRIERLPAVGALAAPHAWTGLGLSGLTSLGFPTTDSSYLLAYAEVGVVGLAALVAVLVAACAVALRGAVLAAGPARAVSLGAGVGAVVLLLAGLSLDAVTTPSVAELFWVLVALGVVAGEGAPGPRRSLGPGWRAAAVLGLCGLGLVLRLTAPGHVAQTWQFETLQPYLATAYAPSYTGVQLRTSVCALVAADLRGRSGTAATCQPLGDGPGQGVLRLQAPDAPRLRALAVRELLLVRQVPTLGRLRLEPRGPAQEGTPTGLRTAPVWLPVLGAVWLLPLPSRRRVPR